MTVRALLLALDFPPRDGGISRLLHSWSADTANVEWFVITRSSGAPGPRLRRSNIRSLLSDLIAGVRWVRAGDQRVVLAGHPYLAALAVLVAIPAGADSASLAFGSELLARGRANRLALRALRRVDTVVAISHHSADSVKRLGVASGRIRVVTPLLAPPWLAASPPRRNPAMRLHLIALTRLTEGYKNIELLLRACAVLKPTGILERLTIIGTGPRLGALREKADQLGVADIVQFVGFVPDDAIANRFAEAHVGLFPSRFSPAEHGVEGFGLAIHEMAAAGIPVLVGNAGGAVDAADHAWAHLLDPDDVWSWVKAIEGFYNDEPRRFTLGTQALGWARAIDPTGSAEEFAQAMIAS